MLQKLTVLLRWVYFCLYTIEQLKKAHIIIYVHSILVYYMYVLHIYNTRV